MNSQHETGEVSIHEVWVFNVFRSNPDKWLTNHQVKELINGKIAPITIRQKTLKLVKVGILDRAEVFPSHRHKLATRADKRNLGYWQRLEEAAKVFDLDLIPRR